MKKRLPILIMLCLMTFASCIKDDIENCPGKMHFHFSFIYGGMNQFFEMEKTDLGIHFYHQDETVRYREISIPRNSIGPQKPYVMEKTLEDRDRIELISWSTDPVVDYVNPPETPKGEGYVYLKEITEGSGICHPADDLFYGRVTFDSKERLIRNDVTIPYVRAVCRVRITMIPETVQSGDSNIIPHSEDYRFHLFGTQNIINDNNIAGGDEIILQPDCFFDSSSGNVMTNWFAAFPGREGEYLKVKIFIRDEQVTDFDCAPIGISSVAGDYIDLIIDGRYVRPIMEVKVNGWRIATVISNM